MQIRDVLVTSQEAVTEESIVGDAKETVVQYGSKEEMQTVQKKVLKTSIVRAYSSRKGDYVYHQTVMRDIQHLLKHGWLKVRELSSLASIYTASLYTASMYSLYVQPSNTASLHTASICTASNYSLYIYSLSMYNLYMHSLSIYRLDIQPLHIQPLCTASICTASNYSLYVNSLSI